MRDSTKSELDLLEDVLDRYGADRTRWPASTRREISALLAQSSEASRLLAEAEAFDRLLDLAPSVDAQRVSALADRIMAKAERGPRIVASQPPPKRSLEVAPRVRRHAGGIAALAASLAIGLFAGQSTSVQPTVTAFTEIVGGSAVTADSEVDPDTMASVRLEDADTNGDGELL